MDHAARGLRTSHYFEHKEEVSRNSVQRTDGHNRTRTVFPPHRTYYVPWMWTALARTKMAACHGGTGPSRRLGKHWIETSLRTLQKQLFEYVSVAALDKIIFVTFTLFSCLPPQLAGIHICQLSVYEKLFLSRLHPHLWIQESHFIEALNDGLPV